MNCMRCGQTWEAGDECPTCGFVQSKAEETILGWYDEGRRAEEEKRYAAAAELYKNAADMGLILAQLAYGRLLEGGRGVKKSTERAKEYYRNAAAYGDAEAAFYLARLLREEKGGKSEDIVYWTQVSAELGHPEAQFALAELYRSGALPLSDQSYLAYWYGESARGGFADAAVKAGELYLSGAVANGTEAHAKWFFLRAEESSRAAQRYLRRLRTVEAEVPPLQNPKNHEAQQTDLAEEAEQKGDNAIAFSLYCIAAESGYARALCRLGICYENGVGTTRDVKEAYARYTAAATAGSIEALLQLAACHRYGRGVNLNSETAFSYYLQAAEKHNARAQYIVGRCYLNGELVERNLRLAVVWFERAAMQGHGDAIAEVNALHETMTEIYNTAVQAQKEGDAKEALRLYVMVAEMGHSAAQCNAGYCYQTGQGCTPDAKAAFRYYLMAAEGGSVVANYNIGLAYACGTGVRLDFARAREYFEKAAKGGYARAEQFLELLSARRDKKRAQYLYAASTEAYRKGDVDERIRLLAAAAKLKSARALYMLGCHFEFGDGVPHDRERAEGLYAAAASCGLDAAQTNLKDGYMRMRKILALSRR